MLFRGLTILKSPKLIIKGGLCYGFAMVYCRVECSSANTQFMEFTQSVPEQGRLEVKVE